ncbi:hypothetical protein BH11MYX4_BH11MYX4_47200 [soil metagenome]
MSAETRAPASVRLGLAVVAAALAATALYALMRLGQKLLFPEPDPATVIWSEHAGYYWRALTAAYVGGMAGFATWLVSAQRADATGRALEKLLPYVVVALVAQGLLLP